MPALLSILIFSLFVSQCMACSAQDLVSLLEARSAAHAERSLVLMVDESLSRPVADLIRIFQDESPGVEVRRESSPSKEIIRKIVDFGMRADLAVLSESTFVREYLIPEYTPTSICFAEDEMVIAYTGDSAAKDKLAPRAWWIACLDENVKFGMVEPRCDPAGYRAKLIFMLAENEWGKMRGKEHAKVLLSLFLPLHGLSGLVSALCDDWFGRYNGIPLSDALLRKAVEANRRPSVGGLLRLLDTGCIDYAPVYRCVAEQMGLSVLRLPPELNLGGGNHALDKLMVFQSTWTKYYSHFSVETQGRTPSRRFTVRGARVGYVICPLKNSPNPENTRSFLRTMLSKRGRKALKALNLDPVIWERRVYDSLGIEWKGAQ